jgi:hypothetical protein
VPRSDSGGGGGVRGGDGLAEGMTRGPPLSASAGERRVELRRWRAGWTERPSRLACAAVGPEARLRRAGPWRGAGCWAARPPRRVRWPAGLALLSGLDRMGGLKRERDRVGRGEGFRN